MLPPLGATYASLSAFKQDVIERSARQSFEFSFKAGSKNYLELHCKRKTRDGKRCKCGARADQTGDGVRVTKVETGHNCGLEDQRVSAELAASRSAETSKKRVATEELEEESSEVKRRRIARVDEKTGSNQAGPPSKPGADPSLITGSLAGSGSTGFIVDARQSASPSNLESSSTSDLPPPSPSGLRLVYNPLNGTISPKQQSTTLSHARAATGPLHSPLSRHQYHSRMTSSLTPALAQAPPSLSLFPSGHSTSRDPALDLFRLPDHPHRRAAYQNPSSPAAQQTSSPAPLATPVTVTLLSLVRAFTRSPSELATALLEFHTVEINHLDDLLKILIKDKADFERTLKGLKLDEEMKRLIKVMQKDLRKTILGSESGK